MAPCREKAEILKKEDIISALLIADDFESSFSLLDENEPKILLPLVNVPIINYTLEFLHASGVRKVVIFCCNHALKIKTYIRDSTWINSLKNMTVMVTISETCMSVGDALRDVYDKRLLTDDFVLIIGGVVSNIQLKPLIDQHRNQKKKDKSTVMTTLFRRHPLSRGRNNRNSTVVAYLEDDKRILFLQNVTSSSKTSIPLDVFMDNSVVNVSSDLLDCQINICSAEVLCLFADNFDYQTRNDFIKGVLVHEEVLGNTVYINIIEEEFASSVTDLQSYKTLSQDIIGRWAVPIAPEQMAATKGEFCTQHRHNVYKYSDVILNSSQLISDVVIGAKSKIGPNCAVSRSIIGDNCEIGANVVLKDVFIWNNAKIGSNCRIECAIVAADVQIGDDVEIKNCVLGEKVEIGSKLKLESCLKSARCEDSGFDEDEEGDASVDPWHLKSLSDDYSSSEEDSDGIDDGESGGRLSPELDDTKLFYRELRDTLIRGLEEKLMCDNLILEINSLKYAYNVTITEVNHMLMKAVLDISEITIFPKEKLIYLKQLLMQFRGIFLNYLKNQTSQMDVLNSLKEYAMENKNFMATIANVIHFLYEKEVLLEEAIISWHSVSLLDDDECESEVKLKVSPLIKWLEEAEEESD